MSESILSKPEIVWFLIGLVLFLLELVIPGFVIFFFGVGAWFTAIICLFAEPGINIQIIIFAITSVLSLVALRRIIQKKFFYNRDNQAIDIDDEFTGKEAVAISQMGPGIKGKVEFKGTTWDAESESQVDNGQTVIILEKENFKLIVEPKNK
jgi:membrane protein implicated in regulation of membrane protease activity